MPPKARRRRGFGQCATRCRSPPCIRSDPHYFFNRKEYPFEASSRTKEVKKMLGELQPWMPGWPSLERFRREMDDLFSRFFGDTEVRGADGTASILPAAESFFKDGKWVMRFDLPGVEPKDIDVSVTGDILTVRASRERRQEHRDAEYERREVEYGRFERSITLPKGVDAEKIKANDQHGVLELTMPVAPEMQGRKIPVEAGAEKKQLEHRAA